MAIGNQKLWVAGESGNKNGRPKGTRHSILTTKGRIERFLYRNMSAKALQALYNSLRPKEQIELLTGLLPYVLPRQGSLDKMSSDDANRIFDQIMENLNTSERVANG